MRPAEPRRRSQLPRGLTATAVRQRSSQSEGRTSHPFLQSVSTMKTRGRGVFPLGRKDRGFRRCDARPVRILALTMLATAIAGCGYDHCLQVLTEGLQPSQTTWVVWAESAPGETIATASFASGQQGQSQLASCRSPGVGGIWRVVVWYDDSGTSPFETYCGVDRPRGNCTPQPGQPFGEKSFESPGSGFTKVSVTIHSP